MTVDEMDLVSQLMDVTPWRPQEYERARAALRGAMAESGTQAEARPEAAPMPAVTPLHGRGSSGTGNRRRRLLGTRGKIGIGAGFGAIAAAAAVALVVTAAPRPAAPTAAPTAAPIGSAAKVPAAHHSTMAVNAKLMSLAAVIVAGRVSVKGDASLVIRHQPAPAGAVDVTYNLYTDSGDLYVTDTGRALIAAIAHHANLADPMNAREVAAARYAATGDLTTAQKRMLKSPGNGSEWGLSLAQNQKLWEKNLPALEQLLKEKGVKTPPKMPTAQGFQDTIYNSIWTYSVDALSYGAGDPQVRAGVLRLLSTIPAVKVASSTTAGQSTLTLTAGSAVFDGDGKDVLTINATNGLPMSEYVTTSGMPPVLVTYKASRVTVSDIKGGKF